MMNSKKYWLNESFLKITVFGLLLLRLILNAIVPVMDKTEARYSEIARIMAETNNWITPQTDYNFPFWAKPPLSSWLSAISIKIFGSNEFAARFPAFLIAIAVILLVWKYVPQNKSKYVAAIILLTLPEFLLHAGVVSTDMSLLISIVLMMLAFWEKMNNGKKYWGYLFFVAMGFGFLAKGPIILILTMPPLVLWAIIFKEYTAFFTKLPWILGLLIAAIIAAPWYYFAEKATPGFIDYFIVGEHFKRFTDPNWKGDKYGFPKIQPLGIIWVFIVAFALPWIIAIFGQLWKDRKNILQNRWICFLILWAFWTPVFFTVSKSLIHTYTLPSMPAFALIAAYYWDKFNHQIYLKIALILPAIATLILLTSPITNVFEKIGNTDKYLIEQTEAQQKPIYFLNEKSYSSQFYSEGKINQIDIETLENKINTGESFYIIIKKSDAENLKLPLKKYLKTVREEKKKILMVNSSAQ